MDYNTNIFNLEIKSILDEHDIEYTELKTGWLKMSCLFPDHDDSNPSFFINPVDRGYNCYGCGRSGKVSELLEILGWKIKDVDSVIIGVSKYAWQKYKEKIEQNTLVEHDVKKLPSGFKIIDKNNSMAKRHYGYLKSRKITNCIKPFKIGFTKEYDEEYHDNYKKRIIIPVHDENGKYIWPEGRLIYKIKARKYYRPYGVNKGAVLFNLHRVKKSKYVVVVEGIIDAMILHVAGYPSVCSFGANLSTEQIALLTRFDSVYLAFDMDKAGITAFKKSKEIMSGLGMRIYRIKLPRHKDVNDIGTDKFKKYFLNSKLVY